MTVRVSNGLYLFECRMEPDRSGSAAHAAWLELEQHERFGRSLVLRVDAEAHGRLETEARVVGRMAEGHDRADAELAAALQACADECRTDALALMRRCHCHGGQPHEAQLRVSCQRHGREHDVTDDFGAVFGNERDNGTGLPTQAVDEIGFRGGSEGREVHGPDGVRILRLLFSDDHRRSPRHMTPKLSSELARAKRRQDRRLERLVSHRRHVRVLMRLATLTFNFFLEGLPTRLKLDFARTVPELVFPFATPGGAATVLAFDLSLELAWLGFDFDLARALPIWVAPGVSPPPFVRIIGKGSSRKSPADAGEEQG